MADQYETRVWAFVRMLNLFHILPESMTPDTKHLDYTHLKDQEIKAVVALAREEHVRFTLRWTVIGTLELIIHTQQENISNG